MKAWEDKSIFSFFGFPIDKNRFLLYNDFSLYVTDGFRGLPRGNVEVYADRLGKSVLRLTCPFLFFRGNAVQKGILIYEF